MGKSIILSVVFGGGLLGTYTGGTYLGWWPEPGTAPPPAVTNQPGLPAPQAVAPRRVFVCDHTALGYVNLEDLRAGLLSDHLTVVPRSTVGTVVAQSGEAIRVEFEEYGTLWCVIHELCVY
ncbi:MAG: hypothetical protein ACYTGC_09690 [Planctomycetota bacterium]|jgi:hypothetical protein